MTDLNSITECNCIKTAQGTIPCVYCMTKTTEYIEKTIKELREDPAVDKRLREKFMEQLL